MAYDFKELQSHIDDTKKWLEKEYFAIRTGRATPAILDGIRIEAYGSVMPLNQVANVGVEDARTLRVLPYDVSQAKEIEKAITQSDIGVSVSSDEKGVRVHFPELTAENRKSLQKVVKDKLEQARVTLRQEREDVWNDIQEKEKAGEISEDEKFQHKEEMQEIIDKGNKELEEIADHKTKELEN